MLLGFLFGIGLSILVLCALVWRDTVRAFNEENR